MDILHAFLGPDPRAGLVVILNLILIETMLSVDNAAVMATMVMRLPEDQRARALRYGIGIGYIFRGLCLVFASVLIKIWWLKPIGGAYLVYLCVSHFAKHLTPKTEAAEAIAEGAPEGNKLYRMTVGVLGPFWSTVISVEIMDLTFSIDNVFAAVAFTDNIYLIWTGVFIGILAMRFVAQGFVRLMDRFPFLDAVAFAVIGILGLKLIVSVWEHLDPGSALGHTLNSEEADHLVSLLTIGLFVLPLLSSYVLGWPKHKRADAA